MARKTYRSMQGKMVDMELLAQQHELTPAIGNARVNARGDELGPGGKIIRKREEIMAEYYDSNPNAVRDEQYVSTKKPVPVSKTTNEVKETVKKTTTRREARNEGKEDKTDS